jgi:YfiH family protein
MSNLDQRKAFLDRIGIRPSRAFFLKQVHSKKVIFLDESRESFGHRWEGAPPQGDGLVTADSQAVLCVGVADCLPLFLFDQESGAFGLLHSGWKGTGILETGFAVMKKHFDSSASRLSVLVGPGIGPCCYRIPEDRYNLFQRAYGEEAVSREDENYYIDLRGANRVLLERLGVARVSVISDCTSCNPLLSSFRRDGEGFSGMLAVMGYF